MKKVVALAGGVGGAKLAHGLAACLPGDGLTVIVNTADDFYVHGLRVCPDLDTVMYTLAGLANPDTGWGMAGDTFEALDMLARYGNDTWFRIGDRDFATHIARTDLLKQGLSLAEATGRLSGSVGVGPSIVPMSNDEVATVVLTPDGELDFQEYFVRHHHEPEVTGVRFNGIERARPSAEALTAIRNADLIVLCPSNPIVSIGPILAVPGMREAVTKASAPKVAVSPIIGGKALKGPADRMMQSFNMESSAFGIAEAYQGVVQGMVIDTLDVDLEPRIRSLGMATRSTNTVMRTDADRSAVAQATLDFGFEISRSKAPAPS